MSTLSIPHHLYNVSASGIDTGIVVTVQCGDIVGILYICDKNFDTCYV